MSRGRAERFDRSGPNVRHDLQTADGRGLPLEGDLAFVLRQARRTGGPIQKLGCGTGRAAPPLARAGFEVVGLDRSPHMLTVARRTGAAHGGRVLIRFVRGVMTRFARRRRFGLVVIPFRAFQRLLTSEAQRSCLACTRRHLRRNGRLVVHLFDPRLEFCLLAARAAVVRRRDRVVDPETHHRFDLRVTGRRNDPLTQTFRETWVWTERDRRGRVLRRSTEALTLRWTYRQEMQYLLELAGFAVVACCGDFRGGPPRYGTEQIWVPRRTA